MDTHDFSVLTPAGSAVADNRTGSRSTGGFPSSGVIHENTRHTSRFTVIGNHLAQHPELSAVAIGLGVHIQSLPTGARVDIKTLTRRFDEGRDRIAGGLRQLEEHGYLRRTRVRCANGTVITRTISCNQPARQRHHADEAALPEGPVEPDEYEEYDEYEYEVCEPREAYDVYEAPVEPPLPEQPEQRPEEQPEERPAAYEAPVPPEPERPTQSVHPAPRKRKKRTARPLPAVPQPGSSSPGLLEAAADLLVGLRRCHSGLLLSAHDVAHLAPGVAAWLERDVAPAAVRHALTTGLPPEGPCRPAAFLAYRLTHQLPPPPRLLGPAPAPPVRHPLQECDGCDRPFRGPEPGRCRDCRGAT